MRSTCIVVHPMGAKSRAAPIIPPTSGFLRLVAGKTGKEMVGSHLDERIPRRSRRALKDAGFRNVPVRISVNHTNVATIRHSGICPQVTFMIAWHIDMGYLA